MKKTTIIFVLAVIACLVLVGCKPTTEPGAPTQPTVPEQPAEEPTEPEAPAKVIETKGNILTDVKCVGDNIQGKIVNVLNTATDISDIRVIFNGMVVNPQLLECDKTTLNPGESTTCQALQGIFPIKATNAVSVAIGSQAVKETITC